MTENRESVKVVLSTLGCKLNQAETELLARRLKQAGYRVLPPGNKADVYILNSCTVTHIADRKSRRLLRAWHRQNPSALIVATGCYARRAPHELASIEAVNVVAGNKEKADLIEWLEKHTQLVTDTGAANYVLGKPEPGARNRAFIKVQVGCNNLCTYCIVPLVKGRETSLPAEQIVAEVRERTNSGYREVVLTGTEIGTYHNAGIDLKQLIKRILSETDIPRLRLSSLQPPEISPELVNRWHDGRLCRHFHLSLQSGSDSVLRRMKRRYSIADYREALALIRSRLPEVAVTTDIIVGFPGETEAEFEESYQLCQKLGFARIHVFPYSKRSGTVAARMPAQVSVKAKKERSQRMLTLAGDSARNFRNKHLCKVMSVLWEQGDGNGVWSGLSDNYIRVYTRSTAGLTNEITDVKLEKLWRDGVWGEVL